MKLTRYLKDRWVILVAVAFSLAFAAAVLHAYGLDAGVIIFIACAALFALACSFAYDFTRRKSFYDEFAAVCADIDRKHLTAVVLERPAFLEGELAYDALRAAEKSMNDEVAASRRASEEYRDYIETWVHEVKTPIAAAELAVENEHTPTTDRIGGELARIEGCVEQALYYARSTTLRNDYLIREVNLERLVKDAVRTRSRVLIGTGMKLTFEGLDQTVPADAKWCAFAIGQIVDNAVKYRKTAGEECSGDSVGERADCSADAADELADAAEQPAAAATASNLKFSATRLDIGTADERVVLSIEDDGIGMPAADIPRAFDRGFTGENGRRYGASTGMGLYLCHRLCSKMGIDLSLESIDGRGTCVSLAFPENRMYIP